MHNIWIHVKYCHWNLFSNGCSAGSHYEPREQVSCLQQRAQGFGSGSAHQKALASVTPPNIYWPRLQRWRLRVPCFCQNAWSNSSTFCFFGLCSPRRGVWVCRRGVFSGLNSPHEYGVLHKMLLNMGNLIIQCLWLMQMKIYKFIWILFHDRRASTPPCSVRPLVRMQGAKIPIFDLRDIPFPKNSDTNSWT